MHQNKLSKTNISKINKLIIIMMMKINYSAFLSLGSKSQLLNKPSWRNKI